MESTLRRVCLYLKFLVHLVDPTQVDEYSLCPELCTTYIRKKRQRTRCGPQVANQLCQFKSEGRQPRLRPGTSLVIGLQNCWMALLGHASTALTAAARRL